MVKRCFDAVHKVGIAGHVTRLGATCHPGLQRIAQRVASYTAILTKGLEQLGAPVRAQATFDTVSLKTDGLAQEGRMIELHCRDWWIIPMRWTCRWKTVQPPQLLVDEIVKGPFTLFIHEHRFEPHGPGRCIMHDTITYQWGHSWWGRLVSETGVKIYLTLLFKYRHHRTRKWADSV